MITTEYQYENDRCKCLRLSGSNDEEMEYIATIHRIVEHYNNLRDILEQMR